MLRSLKTGITRPLPDGGVKKKRRRTHIKTRKAQVTQDKSTSSVAKVCDEYLFGEARIGSLGQVTTKKSHERKWVLLRRGNKMKKKNKGYY